MNKKGQVIFFLFMLAVAIIVLALGLAQPTKSLTDETQSNMNCTNPALDNYQRGACYMTDMTPAYFIIGIISIAFIVIGAKIIIG